MEHIFKAGAKNERPLLLLHGTGGDERSLVTIGEYLSPKAPLLGLRGTVSEHGANRFFKRHGEGNFDLEDLTQRSKELVAEVHQLTQKYQLAEEELIVVGYSNGANIGAHLLLEEEVPFSRGIFFHSMSLGLHTKTDRLNNASVFLTHGSADPIVPKETFQPLKKAFVSRGAAVKSYEFNGGHQLIQAELTEAKKWLVKEN